MDDIEAGARRLFEIDEEFGRDRMQYVAFEKMPRELQQWWKDRFLRKIDELNRINS
jgi:hypothetical protein